MINFLIYIVLFMNSDVDDHFKNTKQVFDELGLEKYSDEDCRITQYVCSLVSTRAAFLASAGKLKVLETYILILLKERNSLRMYNCIKINVDKM